MKEVYIVRHTSPNVKPGICYGYSDIDVPEAFISEAEEIKFKLDHFSPELIISSPLIRCKKLATHLYPSNNIRYDNRIKEMNFGDWEMKPWSEIDEKEIDNWNHDYVNIATPNGENFKTLFMRANDFINKEIKPNNASKITLITHSGIMRCLLSRYLGIPLSKVFRLKLNYGAIIKLSLHNEFEEIEFVK